MQIIRNIIIPGKHQKPILTDIFYQKTFTPKPVVIFAHGFKGFKDWGHFNLMGERFAQEGFVFVKFNFSHNGTTPEHPTEFADLEAFGHNNYSIELDDLGSVIDYILSKGLTIESEVDIARLFLIGHSRGGGDVILKASEDNRVKKVVSWASVNEFVTSWSDEQLEYWRKNDVMYVENSRTKQQMPLYYQLYENYFANLDRLHIPSAVKKLKIPFLIVHGTDDEAVPYLSATEMQKWNPASQLLTIKEGNHVFGAKHPFEGKEFPADAEKVILETVRFLKS